MLITIVSPSIQELVLILSVIVLITVGLKEKAGILL
jgi:hypothetical protein